MIASLASLATRIGTTLAAWIEAAYVLDCVDPSTEEDAGAGYGARSDLTWLPALSGVTVASARAIQSHAERPRI
ncbi:hypothetical protein LN996_14005 [Arthrobacter sp. AK01]|uniref:hypothetical protein n=1 Tax=Micrococcaceae TaxID=1268 RepID=UPI001E583A2E|nr:MULTISPECIES: hypothetical protein [Micrococcaceae]MCD4851930.1 hypothetical protein [Arthrobacter sp. AK01]MCP1412649.1 hypothetical protein [Paenarthrobacter sp. A20]